MSSPGKNNTVLLATLCDRRGERRSAQQLPADVVPQLKVALEKGSGALAFAFGEFLASYATPTAAVQAAVEFQRVLEDISLQHRELAGLGGRLLVDLWADNSADDVALDRMRGILAALDGNGVLVTDAALRQLDGITRGGCHELAPGLHEIEMSHHRVTFREATRPLRAPLQGDYTTLTRGGRDTRVAPDQCPFTIGRDASCSLVLGGPNISRLHARILHDQGYFMFQDESRNGTYLIVGGEEVFVHGGRFPMTSAGIISPGVPLSEQAGEVLRYACDSSPRPAAAGFPSLSLRRPP